MPNTPDRVPTKGEGATIHYWTDRRAATVISSTTKSVWVQEDNVVYNETGYACPENITRNPDGIVREFTFRRNGRWVAKGEPQNGGSSVTFGARRPYYDRSF
jgi:hypothetical protein